MIIDFPADNGKLVQVLGDMCNILIVLNSRVSALDSASRGELPMTDLEVHNAVLSIRKRVRELKEKK